MKIGVLRREKWRNTGIEQFESKIVPYLLDQEGFEPIDFKISDKYPLSGTISRWRLGRKVKKSVSRNNFDVVFVPSQDLMLNLDPDNIDAKIVPYVHDILTVTTAFTSYLVKLLDKKAAYNIEKCQKVLTASDATAAELKERTGFSGISETIYQGVETNNSKKSFADREFDIVYVGTLIDRKDPKTVKEFAEIAQKNNLNMAAVNYEELDLPCQTFENISDEKLSDLLDNSRYYLHPSFQEGFGRGAVEAQGCGTVVIARDNQINNEILESFIQLDSTTDILREIKDSDKWESISKKSIENSKRFKWEDSQKNIASMLREASK